MAARMALSVPSAPDTRPSLLLRLADRHDGDAWTIFHHCYGPLIHWHCRRRGLQEADAAEVTQEVILDVLAAMPDFHYDPRKGRFRAWLGTLTYRQLCRFWRRQRGELVSCADVNAVPIADHWQSWNNDVDAYLLNESLARTQSRVSDRAWRVFVAVWLQDESPACVAHRFGRPVEWVYVTKSRVLQALHREVSRLMDDLALGP